ncbi:MAG: hypothetical protein IIZ48_00925 [Erysipelotrichales bacterium]|nr:hypothetical protein [Erysipelotrichales bacterium]
MKRNKLLLIAGILSLAYVIYLISYFSKGVTESGGTEAIGAGLATMMVTPHMIVVALAMLFNWIGFFLKARWAALTSGILYAVGMALMIVYAMFVIIQMILSFVAYAQMKKA